MVKALSIISAFFGLVAFAATPEIRNLTAKQRYPWNGKVDITYTLTGDVTAGQSDSSIVLLSVTASNRVDGTTYAAAASALSGDTGTAQGVHLVVWDMDAQGLRIKSTNVVFTVAYAPAEYCVVDLFGGANASSYPVSYLADVPSGGFNTDEYKTTKLVLRLVEPGMFMMGGSYQVTLTKPFYCGVFEVTQKQYELVTGSNPSFFKGDMRPVEYVSWKTIRGNSSTYNWPGSANVDSNSFVGRLQARTGLNFDLPTEAQWEYACRAGTTSTYNNGGDTEDDLKQLGRYDGNKSDGKGGYSEHTKVGSYEPNTWGLYDMHGNVCEWCLDWYGKLASGVTDPQGSSSGWYRVERGGCCRAFADGCASSVRDFCDPSNASSIDGFRLARTLSNTEGERSPEAVAGAERAGALYAAEATPVAIDSRIEPVVDDILVSWDVAWIGGNANATVVIKDNGTEVKRTTGVGAFEYTPSGIGRHELTYTTYIGGTAQSEVYTASVYGKWKYDVVNGGAVITETTQTPGAVTIPSEIDGYPVTGIGNGVFKDCTGVTSVVIPQYVCARRLSDVFSSSYQSITNIVILDGVTNIGNSAFRNCTGLTSVTIPASVTSIGDGAFSGCSRLTSVTIPDSVTSIGSSAFYGCSGLTDANGFVIVRNVLYSYHGAGGVVRIPDSVTSIGDSAFAYCYGLTSVTIPDSVTSIGDWAFYNCRGLTSVTIPDSVTSIGDEAFDGCTNLTSVTIPNSVTNIGSYAFYDCSGLTSVTIPDSVTSIGGGAFSSCSGLMSICLPQNYAGSTSVFPSRARIFRYKKLKDQVVTLDANGGTVEPSSVVVDYGSQYGLLPEPSWTGHTFMGWTWDNGGSSSPRTIDSESTVAALDDHTLTAQWQVNQYVVAFDAAGGTGGRTNEQDYASAIVPPTVSRECYTFKGWEPAVATTVPTNDITYVAQWQINRYTVTFDAGGGTGGTTVTQDYGTRLTAPTVTRANHKFMGWSPECPRTVPARNLTCTAVWLCDWGCATNANGTLTITGVNVAPGSTATIPSSIDGHLVTSIGARAFYEQGALTSVTIPDSVTSIDELAFCNCRGLTSMTIPSSVTGIGQGAFRGCSSLTNVTYLGDAPDTGRDIYYGTPRTLVSYVKRGSIGWAGGVSKILPKLWNEREIAYGRASSFGPSEFEKPESVLWADTPDGEVPSVASTYDGYLYDGDGNVKGTIQVKAGKPNAKTGLAAVKATMVGPDGKKKILKGKNMGKAKIAADGPSEVELVGGEACAVTLGAKGMSGTYGDYLIDGGLNVFMSKAADDKATAAAALGRWKGAVNVAWRSDATGRVPPYNTLSVTIAAKGKAKVSGTLADGTKVTASSQLLVGEEWCGVPVVYAKKGVRLAFVLWLPLKGQAARSPRVVGLEDAVVGKPGTLKAGARFQMDADAFAARWGKRVLPCLPDGVPVKGGKTWKLPKAGKVVYVRGTTDVDETKTGDNPSALKLTYTARTGTFKGSFKAYSDVKGKPKATLVNVAGALVDGVGYGSATIKKVGGVAITIDSE